jgi:hypothetical protein
MISDLFKTDPVDKVINSIDFATATEDEIDKIDFGNLTSKQKAKLKKKTENLTKERKAELNKLIVLQSKRKVPKTYKTESGETVQAPRTAIRILDRQEMEEIKRQHQEKIKSQTQKDEDEDDLTRSLRKRETIYQVGSGDISDMPPELILEKMSYLGLSDIRALCNSSKRVRGICTSNRNEIAKYILQNDYGFGELPEGLDYYHIMKKMAKNFNDSSDEIYIRLLPEVISLLDKNDRGFGNSILAFRNKYVLVDKRHRGKNDQEIVSDFITMFIIPYLKKRSDARKN